MPYITFCIQAEINEIWKITASILHLGNLKMVSNNDGSKVADTHQDLLATVSDILQFEASTLQTALTFRSVTIRG